MSQPRHDPFLFSGVGIVVEPSASRRVLLIGWDAADWKFINPLLDAGAMQNLSRLVDTGVIANLATLQPCLSPILWNSIATGKTADKHGITGFVEPIPGGAGVRHVTSTSRTTKAIWNILSQAGRRSIVINWYASHPAEPINGVCVTNRFFDGPPTDRAWTVPPESVHPADLGENLAGLRLHPAEWSGTDLKPFLPDLERIDLSRDPRPRQLAELLARTVSTHCVATGLMEIEPWDLFAVYYDGIDVAGHQFMPYHPPRMPTVCEADFQRYQHVMREMYLFHDAMLGRLLDLAGDDTTVILLSDHGFHCDHLRPTQSAESEEAMAALWHRQYGVLAMRGPGIRRDDRIYGANLLDITPTVLHLMDLPIGQDMDGRPLIQALESPPTSLRTIPSWDGVPGDDGRHPTDAQAAMVDEPAALEQLIALGYLPAATAEATATVAIARAESRFNLAVVHSAHGREKKAIDIFEELYAESPDQPRYALALAKSLSKVGNAGRAKQIVEALEERGLRTAVGELIIAAGLFQEGQVDLAFARLRECEQRYPPSPGLFVMIGNLCLARKQWHEAARAFEKAAALDDDSPHAHTGLAQATLKLSNFPTAAEHALRAIGLLFFNPLAHYILGMAFRGMGEIDRAIRSLEIALEQKPQFDEARHDLDRLRQSVQQRG